MKTKAKGHKDNSVVYIFVFCVRVTFPDREAVQKDRDYEGPAGKLIELFVHSCSVWPLLLSPWQYSFGPQQF
ncbi:hypothetical protein DPMN_094531 [Dreissena polymorpha]|uniref:Uncharacterized protein n=1 Tax=Dreissena polymorpha TaxID=45954 RepID=A0A9D4L587_DREPO|nr:hypothetical protein DPMN_094531 [Dreissena polymorpha]